MTSEQRLAALEVNAAVLKEQRLADRRDFDNLVRLVEQREDRDQKREDEARKQRIYNYFALATIALTFVGLLLTLLSLVGTPT